MMIDLNLYPPKASERYQLTLNGRLDPSWISEIDDMGPYSSATLSESSDENDYPAGFPYRRFSGIS